MSKEVKILALLIVTFYLSFLIPTSFFLNVKKTKVYTDGYVEFTRDPLFNNIVLSFVEEITTSDGKSCFNFAGEAVYEKDNKVVTYLLNEELMPCVEEGATHRVSRQFLYFRPLVTETTIIERENL